MAEFKYSGKENLEAMQVAENYNKYLISLLVEAIQRTGVSDLSKLRILDFGAGIGTYADMLRDEGFTVDCFELDEGEIKTLQDKGYTVYNDLKKVDKKYDMAYALNVFEHIEDDIGVFVELSKHLKKNGVAVVYVPAMQSAFSSMDRLVGHYRRYNLQRLNKMANEADMSIESLSYGDPLGLLAAFAYKFVGNDEGTITKKSVKVYDRFGFPASRKAATIFKKIAGKNAILIAKKK